MRVRRKTLYGRYLQSSGNCQLYIGPVPPHPHTAGKNAYGAGDPWKSRLVAEYTYPLPPKGEKTPGVQKAAECDVKLIYRKGDYREFLNPLNPVIISTLEGLSLPGGSEYRRFRLWRGLIDRWRDAASGGGGA